MKCEVMKVSPEMATKWLEKNIVNRRIRDYKVNAYARDMKNGDWRLNGEAIVFNKSGQLVDGQHRLNAIAKSGVTVSTLVVNEVKDEDAEIFDEGITRKPADSLVMLGADSTLCNNQIIGMIHLVRMTYLREYRLTNSELKEIIDKYHDEILTVKKICSSRGGAVAVHSGIIMAGVFCAYMNGVDPDILKKFINILSDGFYEDKNQSSAIVLRNDIIQKKIQFGGHQNRLDALHAIEKAIFDFVNKTPRKKSYSGSSQPIYSTFEL